MGKPFVLILPLVGVPPGPLCLVGPRSQHLPQVSPLVLQLGDAQGEDELLEDCLRVVALRARGRRTDRLLRRLELEGEHLSLD